MKLSEKPLTEPVGFDLTTEQRLGPKQVKHAQKVFLVPLSPNIGQTNPVRYEDQWSGELTEPCPFNLHLTARLGEPLVPEPKSKVLKPTFQFSHLRRKSDAQIHKTYGLEK